MMFHKYGCCFNINNRNNILDYQLTHFVSYSKSLSFPPSLIHIQIKYPLFLILGFKTIIIGVVKFSQQWFSCKGDFYSMIDSFLFDICEIFPFYPKALKDNPLNKIVKILWMIKCSLFLLFCIYY